MYQTNLQLGGQYQEKRGPRVTQVHWLEIFDRYACFLCALSMQIGDYVRCTKNGH